MFVRCSQINEIQSISFEAQVLTIWCLEVRPSQDSPDFAARRNARAPSPLRLCRGRIDQTQSHNHPHGNTLALWQVLLSQVYNQSCHSRKLGSRRSLRGNLGRRGALPDTESTPATGMRDRCSFRINALPLKPMGVNWKTYLHRRLVVAAGALKACPILY